MPAGSTPEAFVEPAHSPFVSERNCPLAKTHCCPQGVDGALDHTFRMPPVEFEKPRVLRFRLLQGMPAAPPSRTLSLGVPPLDIDHVCATRPAEHGHTCTAVPEGGGESARADIKRSDASARIALWT